MTSGLYAISPLDGRYAEKTAPLRAYFSEWALIKYRLRVEVAWLLALADNPAITHIQPFTPHERGELDGIVADFDEAAATRVKAIEAETRHDVKAVEYYLRERLPGANLGRASSSIHFACTSADINNLAYALIASRCMRQVWQPEARALQRQIGQLARATAGSPMLARTHGQAATPTTLGKELAVFVGRLRRQLESIESQSYLGKFNGAVGAYNAHHVAYPDLDWLAFTRGFVESLGLTFNPLSTQIEAHDWLAELAHGLMRYNTILLDFCRDCWTYIALGYFRQQQRANEVGSSTMPHKVNPIDFENAEANLGLSSATLSHLASKLPVSRLQRDLSDSSAMRNFGAALAHSYLALLSIRRGLSKVDVDEEALARDLEGNWALLAEAVQTVMRMRDIDDAYEQLKALTRGQEISRASLHEFIDKLEIPSTDKQRLKQLRPHSYIGLARDLALSVAQDD